VAARQDFISRRLGIDEADIVKAGRWGNQARRVCLYLLRQYTDMSNAEIATKFQASPSAISKASERVKQEIEHNKALKSFIHDCEQSLSIFKV